MLFTGKRMHRRKKSNTLPHYPSILLLSEIPTCTLPKQAGWEQDIKMRLYPLSSGFDEFKPQDYNEKIRCYYFSPRERTATNWKAYTTRLRPGGISSLVLNQFSSFPLAPLPTSKKHRILKLGYLWQWLTLRKAQHQTGFSQQSLMERRPHTEIQFFFS